MLIASLGFAAGLANMTEGNILFDGASLGKWEYERVYLCIDFSHKSWWFSPLALGVPQLNQVRNFGFNVTRSDALIRVNYIGILTISQSTVEAEIIKQLKNIAAAHFIIVLAITGIVGLQITHYVLNKRADQEVVKSTETKKTK